MLYEQELEARATEAVERQKRSREDFTRKEWVDEQAAHLPPALGSLLQAIYRRAHSFKDHQNCRIVYSWLQKPWHNDKGQEVYPALLGPSGKPRCLRTLKMQFCDLEKRGLIGTKQLGLDRGQLVWVKFPQHLEFKCKTRGEVQNSAPLEVQNFAPKERPIKKEKPILTPSVTRREASSSQSSTDQRTDQHPALPPTTLATAKDAILPRTAKVKVNVSSKRQEWRDVAALESTWRQANKEAYPDEIVLPWRKGVRKIALNFMRTFGGLDTATAVLVWGIKNYEATFGWMTQAHVPALPDIGFFSDRCHILKKAFDKRGDAPRLTKQIAARRADKDRIRELEQKQNDHHLRMEAQQRRHSDDMLKMRRELRLAREASTQPPIAGFEWPEWQDDEFTLPPSEKPTVPIASENNEDRSCGFVRASRACVAVQEDAGPLEPVF